MTPDPDGFADRVLARLDRLDLEPGVAARTAGLTPEALAALLDGRRPPPRGRALLRLAEALSTTAAYLIGLDPDDPLPPEYAAEDQADLGLLSPDEETLLRAYRRLDHAVRSAILLLATRLAPTPVPDEKRARQVR